jgi:hypothetical protein
MRRGISDADMASELGILEHLKITPTVKNVVAYLSKLFNVSETYAEARLHEIIENVHHGFIINGDMVELFNEGNYDAGKRDALMKQPTRMVSKDYIKGYREGKQLLKYLSELGLDVVSQWCRR